MPQCPSEPPNDSGPQPRAPLTARETECLRLLPATNKQIALILGISPDTVKQHIASASKKLGARDRHEAARALALHAGDVTPPQQARPLESLDYRTLPVQIGGDGEGAASAVGDGRLTIEWSPPVPKRMRSWPFQWALGDDNELTTRQRIVWIAAISVAPFVLALIPIFVGVGLGTLAWIAAGGRI